MNMDMTRALRIGKQVMERKTVIVGILLAIFTLSIDFAAGRELRFPLLYVIPVATTAWLGKKRLAYLLALLLPFVRVVFENLWLLPESIATEIVNALIEIVALCLYVHLVARASGYTTEIKTVVTDQQEGMRHLRSFARMMGVTLQGRGVSPGLADGLAQLYIPEQFPEHSERRISQEEVKSEATRVESAFEACIEELNTVRGQLELNGVKAAIELADMRVAMLSDTSFAQGCIKRLTDGLLTAEGAVLAETKHLAKVFQESKREFMNARASDVQDMCLQLLRKLATPGGAQPHRLSSFPSGTVVVAQELLLSDALQMDPVNVVAIVMENTGPASHVAMLARSRGIPAISDINNVTSLLASGNRLLVDADVGTVTVAPTSSQAASFTLRKSQAALVVPSPAQEPSLPCLTKDNVEIGLHANVGHSDEAVILLEHGLDGVGLFRSEFLFLHAERPPTLETQTAAYSEIASMLAPCPVVIRTMDLGGDKMPRFGGAGRELVMRAGLRGLAYSLVEKTMFRIQIQAIVKAAQKGNVRIMFPMVMGVEDLTEARRFVDEVAQHEPPGERPAIGAMIETPAAVFDIHGILQVADFVSIGTNDLTNSILSMERGTQGHSGHLAFFHPSVLRATYQVVHAAKEAAVSVSVCGEAACDPAAAILLVGMGVRNLSINSFMATHVRHAIRQMTLDQMHTLAMATLRAKTAKEVQAILADQRPNQTRNLAK